MNAELVSIADGFAGAAINGVWQGTALVAMVWGILKLFPRTNAATKHGVAFLTLILVAILSAAHLKQKAFKSPVPPSEDEGMLLKSEIAKEGAEISIPILAGVDEAREITSGGEPEPISTGSEVNGTFGSERGVLALGGDFLKPKSWSVNLPEIGSLCVFFAWIGIAGTLLARLIGQFLSLQRWKRAGTPAPAELNERFEKIHAEQKVGRKARLLISREAEGPMVAGFLRPAVLLPLKVLESVRSEELDRIYRHELAHIARRDDWVNAAQQVIRALLFFHPGVHWLCRNLSVEREIACDDQVLAAEKSRAGYARLLTEFAGGGRRRELLAAPAAWSNKTQLKQRIDMILDTKRNASPRVSRGRAGLIGTGALLCAAAALQLGPRVLIAQEQPTRTDEISIESDIAEVNAPVAAAEPSAVSAGPRIKAVIGNPPAVAALPAPPQIAGVPSAGAKGPLLATTSIAAVPPAPMIASTVNAQEAPRTATPRPGRRTGDDLERRLSRLEQMVESLLADEKGKAKSKEKQSNFQFDLKGPRWEGQDMKEFHGTMKLLNEEELARIREEARRAGDIARRETDKVMREIQRSNRGQSDYRYEELPRNAEQLKMQRKSLEEQRRALERQMQALEKQAQKLEEAQRKMEEQREKKQNENSDSNANEDDAKPKKKL